jgi:putative ABC transport system permease protein
VLGSSAKASVDRAVEEQFLGDLVVSNVVGGSFSTAIGDRIERVDGVDSVTRLRYGSGGYSGDGGDVGIAGMTPGSLEDVVALDMVAGSTDDLVDGTVLFSQAEADAQGVAVGDTVRYAMPSGEQEYEVAGIYAENALLTFPVTTTLGTLEDAGFENADNYLIVNLDQDADPAVVQERAERATGDVPTVTVKDQQGFAEEQRAGIDQLLTMIYALLGLALVIAVLGIVNTLALSVIERTREVGLLRAVGLSRAQLRRMVRLEAAAIAVLGAVLGIGMGLVFGLALVGSLADEGLAEVVVPGGQLALFVAAAAVLGVLAAVLPARRAARLDVLRAIATE